LTRLSRAARVLVAGLWPDYGSIYDAPGPQAPFFNGTQKSYQVTYDSWVALSNHDSSPGWPNVIITVVVDHCMSETAGSSAYAGRYHDIGS
jgi:hypothetical protein